MKPSIIQLTLSLILLLCGITHADAVDKTAAVPASLGAVKQNSLAYLPNHSLSTQPNLSPKLAGNYLKHFFSPWTGIGLVNSLPEVKTLEQEVVAAYVKNPGWGENGQMHTHQWVTQIAADTQLASFPNYQQKAITVQEGAVRMLPTDEPSFKEPDDYPFDRLQQSFLAANTPVLILHASKNRGWYLIMTANSFGWIKNQNVARVSPAFIQHWRTPNYVVATQDATVVPSSTTSLPLKIRLSTIYPLQRRLIFRYEILTAVANSKYQGQIRKVKVKKWLLAPFPQQLSYKKIATTANHMLGDPYGWGGLYGYRDCSSTMMDLMSGFGIWLPRNSQDQVDKVGRQISLQGMSDAQKEATIIKYGIPFLTLIHLPGHIMLYIGSKNGKAYVYQSVWVFHGTVITPLQVVSSQSSRTILGAVDKVTILVPRMGLQS
jgi:hypothetical protein